MHIESVAYRFDYVNQGSVDGKREIGQRVRVAHLVCRWNKDAELSEGCVILSLRLATSVDIAAIGFMGLLDVKSPRHLSTTVIRFSRSLRGYILIAWRPWG